MQNPVTLSLECEVWILQRGANGSVRQARSSCGPAKSCDHKKKLEIQNHPFVKIENIRILPVYLNYALKVSWLPVRMRSSFLIHAKLLRYSMLSRICSLQVDNLVLLEFLNFSEFLWSMWKQAIKFAYIHIGFMAVLYIDTSNSNYRLENLLRKQGSVFEP